jgi:hypothetical protein
MTVRLNYDFYTLTNQLDFTISRWCFRHLVDPVGTFAQAYTLLRPQSGLITMDGFFYLAQDDDLTTHLNATREYPYMISLLLDTKAPFLFYPFRHARTVGQFILKKKEDKPCQLPLTYVGTEKTEYLLDVGSGYLTRFNYQINPKALGNENLKKY